MKIGEKKIGTEEKQKGGNNKEAPPQKMGWTTLEKEKGKMIKTN